MTFNLFKNLKLKIKNCRYRQNGFTLIEMMVSLAVFMVVMTITLSAFLNIADIQKKTEAFRKVNDNLNHSMEMIMREIREGKDYCNGTTCNETSFTFTSRAEGTLVTYSLNQGGKYIERCVSAICGNEDGQRLTSDDVDITSLYFTVSGEKSYASDDRQQPRVTISISGESGVKNKLKSSLNLQATVSQRKIDS